MIASGLNWWAVVMMVADLSKGLVEERPLGLR